MRLLESVRRDRRRWRAAALASVLACGLGLSGTAAATAADPPDSPCFLVVPDDAVKGVDYFDACATTLISEPADQAHLPFAQYGDWLAASWWQYDDWFSGLDATMIVPEEPTETGCLDYFFPSFTNSVGESSIIQPVLTWGASNAEGSGNYWTMNAWHVVNGLAIAISDTVRVSVGDVIETSMRSSNCTADGICDWTITLNDITNHSTTGRTLAAAAPFNIAQGGDFNGTDIWGHLANGQGYICDYYVTESNGSLIYQNAPIC